MRSLCPTITAQYIKLAQHSCTVWNRLSHATLLNFGRLMPALNVGLFVHPCIAGPAWSVLYALMGTASWMVWKNGGGAVPLTLYGIQLALNFAW